ncbi:hypothetical protein ACSS7Z_08485 [Microbacterium sp. A82]|uniref:hypothetical protein n=1 Tax=Microbacterium sp. A82 TaxID=3450452 RepID=UPI003F3473BE
MTPAEGDKPAAGDQSLAAALGGSSSASKPGTPITPGGPAGASPSARAAATVAAAPTMPGVAPAASGGKRTLAQRAIDRVPVKWLSTAALVVFLGVTALFGGLESAPMPQTPVIAAGDTFIGGELEMTPMRLTVIDKLNSTGIIPTPGEQRILSLVMDVRNLSEFARASSTDSVFGLTRVEGLQDVLESTGMTELQVMSGLSPSLARLDDGTLNPWLQPEIPVRVVLSWAVPVDAFSDGDSMRLALPTSTRRMGQSVLYGVYWSDQHTGAYVDLAIEDLGKGEAE